MDPTTVQLRQKGTITLPRELRRRYNLGEGEVFTLVDLGGGSFLLTPRLSTVAQLGDRVASILAEEGVSVDEIIAALDQEREDYYREQYAETKRPSGQ
jgi:bifunctional DNA-binding transcriptional regulator/antitoxin component of YhaV-PrlF toxin-antitoxin module